MTPLSPLHCPHWVGGEPSRARPVEVRYPQIVGLAEGDPLAARRGIGKQACVVNIDGNERCRGQQKSEKWQSAKSHEGSLEAFLRGRGLAFTLATEL